MNRREFAKNTFLASAAITTIPVSSFASAPAPAARTLKKGIMWDCIKVGKTIAEKFEAAKLAGFDGVELMSHLNRDEVLAARDKTGLPVSSVCDALHWKLLLSDPDPKVREQGVEALKVSLLDAKAYGGDTVLLVPGRVSEQVSYDDCWNRSIAEINKVIPLAEKLNVKIAIENVWNNFLLSPMEMAQYIDQFQSKMVASYFDCGNIVNTGWPEQWIKILGPRIAKVHIKEFSRKIAEKQGKGAGFDVKLLDGDVNWPLVMKAFDAVNYHGWTSVEMSGGDTPEGLKDLCDRLAKIHAG